MTHRMYDNPLEAIGNTPLVKLQQPNHHAALYAKLEYLNPGGSVKDRSAKYMIEHAEKTGLLKPGGVIVDASSGNHGIAVAMIGAMKGYKVIITVSEKSSSEKINAIKAYGATVIMCPPTEFIEDPRGYHSVAERICAETPGSFMPNQYFNLVNAEAHYNLLGKEIWEQTDGKVTHFIAAAGTGGTISGAGKYLKEKNPNITVLAVDSINSFRTTGGHPKPYAIEGMGVDFVSPVLNTAIINDFLTVTDEESTDMLKSLVRTQGLLVGPSSGAVAAAAYRYVKTLTSDALVVAIFGDSGRAYLTKPFYVDADTNTHQKTTSCCTEKELSPKPHQP